MSTATIHLDSTARLVERAPFASESGLQRFVEEHCEAVLGIKVIASARAGGGRMFNIDILAADGVGRPWIIECKHRIVDNLALKQLQRYRDALVRFWDSARQQLETRHSRVLPNDCDPVLVLVGIRIR